MNYEIFRGLWARTHDALFGKRLVKQLGYRGMFYFITYI